MEEIDREALEGPIRAKRCKGYRKQLSSKSRQSHKEKK